MQHIKIHTDFDITNTGVTRNFKDGSLPTKINGREIKTKEEWTKMRRQQANWETLVQMISLRTQPLNIRTTVNENGWTLEFDIESPSTFQKGVDLLGLLKEDLDNIPLLTGLDEKKNLELVDRHNYPSNIRFETYEI